MSQRQFRIGDLANELKVKKFVIRFWEQEFQLSSERSQGGHRFYTDEDLKTFQLIKTLLYHQGYTIEGARKQLPLLLKEQATSASALGVAMQGEAVQTEQPVVAQESCGGAYVSHDEQVLEVASLPEQMHAGVHGLTVPCSTCEKQRQHLDHIKHELQSLKHRIERL
jgi:DNA-binding transcriptional MerR regulator